MRVTEALSVQRLGRRNRSDRFALIAVDTRPPDPYAALVSEPETSDLFATPGGEIASDSRCFVCGLANRHGLAVRFFREGEGAARATCEPGPTFMGYDGLLHGGVSAALLDEIMIKAVLAGGHLVVTGRLEVAYRKPVCLGAPLLLHGEIMAQKGRLFQTTGWLSDQSKTKMVVATGTYVEVTGREKERLLEGLRRESNEDYKCQPEGD